MRKTARLPEDPAVRAHVFQRLSEMPMDELDTMLQQHIPPEPESEESTPPPVKPRRRKPALAS